ncbi:hypothetical protein [Enterococcus mediterraneensis]|uniref:hypothetical protein n=1 Tax=Enterococcus mediterraneensis TaxID=2364791 RepID=UPI000F061867|nr:hypothetical protein [Enterococcus mediterraneensis]
MLGVVSLKEWVAGERFSIVISPILIGLGALLILVLLFSLFYLHYRFSKHVAIASLVGILLLVGVFFLGKNQYTEFNQLNRNVLPNIRDRERTFTGYEFYERDTLNYYKRYQNRKGIESLEIYKSEPVDEPVEYLGTAYDSFYFMFRNNVVYLRDKAAFTSIDQAELTGIKYILQKPEFATIGFFETTNNFLDELKIPESQKEKVYEPIDGKKARPFESAQTMWATFDE